MISSLGASPDARQPVTSFAFRVDSILDELCPSDKSEYLCLVRLLAAAEDRNKRNLGLPTFIKHLEMIHRFVQRGDNHDALRGCICGIEFGVRSFLINTRQLRKLMFRSKSCLNGCFQRIGYSVARCQSDVTAVFADILPPTKQTVFSPRQWCVRKADENATVTFAPNADLDFARACRPLPEPAPANEDSEFVFQIERVLNHPVPRGNG
jgi:hypothetical protein